MKLLSVVLAAFFLAGPIFIASAGTPAVKTLSNVRYVIGTYRDAHQGKYPTSWTELIQSELLSGQILSDARRFCQIDTRYQFLNLPTSFNESGKPFRIIVMAKGPGEEGNRERTDTDGDQEVLPGRYVVVEGEGGVLETRRYSEQALEFMFKNSGVNLSDYTPLEPPIPQGARQPEPAEGSKEPKDGVAVSPPIITSPKVVKPVATETFPWWLAACAFLSLLIVAAVGYRLFRSRKTGI